MEETEYFFDQWIDAGWERAGLWLGWTVVVTYLIWWPASRLVAGKNATGRKTSIFFAQACGYSVIFTGIAYLGAKFGWASLVGFGSTVTFLFELTRAAKKVYEISVGRGILVALSFPILIGVPIATGEWLCGPLPGLEMEGKSPEEQKVLFEKWREKKRLAKIAATPTPSPTPARPQTVAEIYTALQLERQQLDVNDPGAVARFNEHVAAYNAAKAAATPTTPVPTPPVAATPKPAKAKDKKRRQD
jgi:hypothetical protein